MSFSRLLMTVSAGVLAALGLAATFLPQELLARLGLAPDAPLVLLVQVLGALWLGFAMLDWMARGSAIGGIYGRPLVVGNLLHFASASLAFGKLASRAPELRALWPLGLVYALLALGFAVAMFRAPAPVSSGAPQ